ncbi:hypothetical protein [Rhizobium rhizogenes]|uniref:hypothetical protein n=1 Tax=Rhizobium rhizogenes TaxID=359 RepID=UPI00080FD1A4|nr:hypothetical protein [Rhizobium rhizogenes]NTI44225.1 hypothetical protein [Rhizobium rhizogenes]OCJ19852.1 hypothetical protein A6U88_32910 [Agrobacterium sp. B131/95]
MTIDNWIPTVHQWFIAVAIFFGLFAPGSLVLIRETVKRHRREVIQDLAAVFNLPGGPASDRLIPSFEFVKFKYFMPMAYPGLERYPRDFPVWAWIVGIVPFCALSGMLTWICLSLLAKQIPPYMPLLAEISEGTFWPTVVSVAFLGAYLAAMRGLSQAIHNFDLSPSLFISSTIDMLAGLTLATLFVSVLKPAAGLANAEMSVSIVAAFAVGYLPQTAQRALISRSRLWNFKRENASIYKYFKATPLELIDGIDTQIRDRLSDFHIISPQNLAAANPLMLFVETPYGVYQIMDWVAQAQLCASVGPNALAELWKLGVRTIFDLERLASDHRSRNSKLLRQVGAHLLGPNTQQDDLPDEATVLASIQMRLDDPYVHRLRQIYMQVGERIGPQYWRFFVRSHHGPDSAFVDDDVFCPPDTIKISHHELAAGPGDRLRIIGGTNNDKLVTVAAMKEDAIVIVERNIVEASSRAQGEKTIIIRITQ